MTTVRRAARCTTACIRCSGDLARRQGLLGSGISLTTWRDVAKASDYKILQLPANRRHGERSVDWTPEREPVLASRRFMGWESSWQGTIESHPNSVHAFLNPSFLMRVNPDESYRQRIDRLAPHVVMKLRLATRFASTFERTVYSMLRAILPRDHPIAIEIPMTASLRRGNKGFGVPSWRTDIRMRFDMGFVHPSGGYSVLVEVDGEQHFSRGGGWGQKHRCGRDALKDAVASLSGALLIRVSSVALMKLSSHDMESAIRGLLESPPASGEVIRLEYDGEYGPDVGPWTRDRVRSCVTACEPRICTTTPRKHPSSAPASPRPRGRKQRKRSRSECEQGPRKRGAADMVRRCARVGLRKMPDDTIRYMTEFMDGRSAEALACTSSRLEPFGPIHLGPNGAFTVYPSSPNAFSAWSILKTRFGMSFLASSRFRELVPCEPLVDWYLVDGAGVVRDRCGKVAFRAPPFSWELCHPSTLTMGLREQYEAEYIPTTTVGNRLPTREFDIFVFSSHSHDVVSVVTDPLSTIPKDRGIISITATFAKKKGLGAHVRAHIPSVLLTPPQGTLSGTVDLPRMSSKSVSQVR